MEYFHFLKEAVASGTTYSEETSFLTEFYNDPNMDVEKYIQHSEIVSHTSNLRLTYSKFGSLN